MSDLPRTKQRLAPISRKGKWNAVSVTQDTVSVKGGYNAKGEYAQCIHYRVGSGVNGIFVAMDKNAQWLLKGVGGAKVQKGELKAVQVEKMVRQRFQHLIDQEAADRQTTSPQKSKSHADGETTSPHASKSPAVADDDIDPMDELDDFQTLSRTKPPWKSRCQGKSRAREKMGERACGKCRFPPGPSALAVARKTQRSFVFCKAAEGPMLTFTLKLNTSTGCSSTLPTSTISKASHQSMMDPQSRLASKAIAPQSRTCMWNGSSKPKHGTPRLLRERSRTQRSACNSTI